MMTHRVESLCLGNCRGGADGRGYFWREGQSKRMSKFRVFHSDNDLDFIKEVLHGTTKSEWATILGGRCEL